MGLFYPGKYFDLVKVDSVLSYSLFNYIHQEEESLENLSSESANPDTAWLEQPLEIAGMH